MTRPVKLSHRIEYLAIQAVTQTVGNLPLGVATGFAARIARIVGMRTSLRRRAERNLGYALPEMDEAERKAVLVEMFDALTRTMVEFRYLPKLNRETDRIEIEGLEHLEAARAKGKGAVLASGHFGNWEVIRLAFARQGWPPALIYRPFNNSLFDDFAQRLMSETDAPIFHKGRRGTLGLLRHVRDGGCALILTDQRFSRSPKVPFFGKLAQTSLGAAEICTGYGAVLLPVRGERIGRDSRFRVIVESPIPTEGRDPLEITAEINRHVENWARSAPEQYFWLHNRWGKKALRGVETNQ